MATTSARPAWRDRVHVELATAAADARRDSEIVAFVQYCVERIERELGEVGRWTIRLTPHGIGFTTSIVVELGRRITEIVTTGFDGSFAIWDAMCRIEQSLRELHGRSFGRAFDVV